MFSVFSGSYYYGQKVWSRKFYTQCTTVLSSSYHNYLALYSKYKQGLCLRQYICLVLTQVTLLSH